ncbi:MAG: chromosome segregation protein SMC [Bacteroidota bacterium]|nr:chromosome segregation protein SMC [Chlorobiota bacterium]MDW8074266.1 chromosome segregation protein SMC [Bacteroidota bacterium]MDW8271258.1 chromosome segregation protein SMC [Bacteroidota bacterium]
MYLSRVELHGFKSFADRTILQFSDGLTAIVGPNGSGKTNIIDAIRWVLGEQKPSLLRADGMSNVIFNGTRTRKPLGMAEVSLVIENTKQILPTEFSQVVITRRLFRDGESQYLLNGSICRRKDIVDMFADTGMGADAYSVIELKMVEQILEDHSDERRHLFEEAAGIVKYKQRRKEALSKLEATRADIDRLLDHITEVRRSVGSLKRQAERAERYHQLTRQLRQLEIERNYRTYQLLTQQLEELEHRIVSLNAERLRLSDESSTIEQQIAALHDELSTLEQERDTLVSEEQRLSTAIAQLDRSCAVVQERITATEESLASMVEDARSRSAMQDQLEGELEKLSQQAEQLEQELHIHEQERQNTQRQLEQAREHLDTLRQQLETISEPLRLLEREHERRSTLRAQLRRTVEQLHQRAHQLTSKISHLQAERQHLLEEHHRYTTRYEAARQTVLACETQLAAARRERENAEHTIEQLRQRRQALSDELSLLRADQAVLSSIVDYSELDPAAAQDFPLGIVTVGDLLSVPPTWSVAVESALSGIERYIVVESRAQLEQVKAWLYAQGHKRLHIVCKELIPRISPSPPLPSSTKAQWLSSFITCDEPLSWFIHAVLAGIAATDSLDDAENLFAAFPQIVAVATPEGQIRFRTGIVRLGRPHRMEGLSIGRRQRLHAVESRIAEIEGELASIESDLSATLHKRDQIVLPYYAEQLRLAEREMLTIERMLDEFVSRRQQLERQMEELEAELKAIVAEQTSLVADDAALEETIRENDRQRAQMLQEHATLIEHIQQQEIHIARLEERIHTTELGAARLRAQIESVQERLADLHQRRDSITFDHQWAQAEHQQRQEHLSALREELEKLSAELSSLRSQYTAISAQRHELDGKRALQYRQRDSLFAHAAAIRSQREQVEARITELRLEQERARTLRMRLEEDIRTRYHVELATYTPTTHETNSDLDSAIAQYTAQIAALGSINFSALEQYQQERERLEQLEQQYRDLHAAAQNLQQTIVEINTTASELFLRTFESIRQHFRELFALLFQGDGEADLVMDGDNPLDARINIIARPKGKRPVTIEMLSGGEKTLTAIALLFAIYMVKPSPFCILDEVDAPLDDANIDRFLQLIRRFSATTQFLLITHNKRTMEAADVLYGVTMEEPGVSKIVSVRLTDPEPVPPSTHDL